MTTAIVIGAGIAGCSTAHALAKRGVKVTLIERHEKIAQEASGNHIATLYPKLSKNETAQNKLTLQGFAFTLDLLNSLPNSNQFFNACGQIQLAFDTRELARQRAIVDQPNHLELQLLTANQASDLAGIALKTGGLFCANAGWVKPADFCAALLNLPNIQLMTLTKALKIEKSAHNWLIKTDNKVGFVADIVVICNAYDIKQFSVCQSAALTSVRGQVNYFNQNATSQAIKTIICGTHYCSPAVDGMHSIGATYAPNDVNPHLNAIDTRSNLQALRHISPCIYASILDKNLNGRVAWRSQTLDYLPLAGQLIDEENLRANPPRYNTNPADLPWLKGLYVNAGHGSKGMITAPLCGELIARLATNESIQIKSNDLLENFFENSLISRLNPSRFLLRELGLKQLAATLY